MLKNLLQKFATGESKYENPQQYIRKISGIY